MDPSQTVSLLDNVNEQDLLLRAAASSIPHQFDKCTYNLGYLRQQVSLCLDCAEPRGLCGACAVSCHGEHVQIELFPKRNFRCDCPTRAMRRPCQLSAGPNGKSKEGQEKEEINEFNSYNHNYQDGGRFCRCHSHYDATHERETMVQCLACEDWFHESCLNLRERIQPFDGTTTAPVDAKNADTTVNPEPEKVWDYADSDDEDDDPSIPPALIPASDYDAFVCGECLIQSPMLLKWAGSTGARMVVRDDTQGEWYVYAGGKVTGESEAETKEEPMNTDSMQYNEGGRAVVGEKRTRDEMEAVVTGSTSRTTEEPPAKKARTEASTSTTVCIAPTPDAPIQALLDRIKAAKGPYMEGPGLHGAGDIFFTPEWRGKWCRCKDCSFQLASRPYLEEEEETYELPDDPDAGLSLEDLGMKALSKFPRDQAIDGIRAFQAMSADFSAYLAPFAQEGKVVTKEDVNAFFAARRQEGKR
ncbi:hypothetical protein M408DRAFT_329775 [Serendipita vermifera MAFF 305830]|uniref:UBR-type domain-containing protein n=1 Tax=Serendipita vermifera MAFF 305830 TaxID=933852 RepID=A0A0C2XFB0_SERVB|nr:hypothetical protein M408DRAFT_329775 [Serendipita vermifera MAFF 305830]